MISLILPSRARSERAYQVAKKWLDNAGCDVEFILSVDKNDDSLPLYLKRFEGMNVLISDNDNAVMAINAAAEKATGSILVVMSDDFDCPPLWGKKIIDATQDKIDWIMKTGDDIQSWIITLPIMDRAYYDRFGYVYYPGYLHLFCDTELTAVADMTARKIVSDIPFIHNHYSTGKNEKDGVSIRADKTWEQGEKLFISRYKMAFELKETPGKITDESYLQWIKGKL